MRLDAIAYGVVLARLVRHGGYLQRHWRTCFIVGLLIVVAIAINWLFRIRVWEIHGLFWRVLIFNLTALGFLLMFPAALRLRILSPRLVFCFTWLSALSYGLYLVHLNVIALMWPLISPGGVMGSFALILSLVMSFALAAISYGFVELPILKLRPTQFGARKLPLKRELEIQSVPRNLADPTVQSS